MKKFIPLLLLAAAGMTAIFPLKGPAPGREKESPEPNDYLFLQRAYPYADVPSEAYYAAVDWARKQVVPRSGPDWQLAGPANVGGRITDIAMHASDQQTIYVASASGGVWKSTDAGQNWLPISDGLPSLSIGDIAIDPSDKNTLYCGTGETNGGGGSVTYDGRGVFKSADGGATWSALGLENTGSIGRIEVDPRYPQRIYVAAMGHLFGNNPERGLYRSIDGGQNWTQSLFINDSTGIIDLAVHPQQSDTLFAVAWERVRRPAFRRYGGPGCGIYRSYDGGDTWTKLSGGLPVGNLGRIGIAIAPSSPNILYATVADKTGNYKGTYISTNLGTNWTALPAAANPNYSNYGWWFAQIRVNPTNANQVHNLGLLWTQSNNGGTTWQSAGPGLHVDQHALFIHPANPDLIVEGNDGGVYISQDGGLSFDFHPLPITQFYTSEIDFQHPERLYGGAQDNSTWRTLDTSTGFWEQIWGGDGFVTLVNPQNSGIWYAESQYGGFGGSNGAASPAFARANWNTPYVFDPADPNTMYFGAERLFKSTNGGLNWTPVSDDLSDGPGPSAEVVYGTITTIAVSPLDGQTIWAGTDDGNVWVTPNGGNSWSKVSAALPKRWITRITADPFDAATAYVCCSGFRHFENIAHIYKTTDRGETWTSVAGNLPDMPVNDLLCDPLAAGHLLIATDAGVFASDDDGQHWSGLGNGLPNVPVLDLTLHAPTRALVAATFGRSMFRTQLPVPVGTQAPVAAVGFEVGPNPFGTQLHLRRKNNLGGAVPVRIWDAHGRLMVSEKVPAGAAVLDIETAQWQSGVYFVQMNGQSRKVVRF